jgi:hypothetical protein
MMNLPGEVQQEVARMRNMIAEMKTLLPDANVSFIAYEMMIAEAERAVREQDTVALIRILQELQDME